MLRKSGPARALDPCHRPEGSWALVTRMGAVVRTLISHQCGADSNLRPGVISGLSLLLVVALLWWFLCGSSVFLPSQNQPFNSIWKQWTKSLYVGSAIANSYLFIYLFIYLSIYLFVCLFYNSFLFFIRSTYLRFDQRLLCGKENVSEQAMYLGRKKLNKRYPHQITLYQAIPFCGKSVTETVGKQISLILN